MEVIIGLSICVLFGLLFFYMTYTIFNIMNELNEKRIQDMKDSKNTIDRFKMKKE